MKAASVVALLSHRRTDMIREGAASVPLWLNDDAIVHRAVSAKRTHPPSPVFWPRLAVMAQLGVAILGQPHDNVAAYLNARRLLGSCLAELPSPAPARYDPRRFDSLRDVLRHRPQPAADLATCVTVVAHAIAHPYPPSLNALSIVLDETAIAIWLCRYAAAVNQATAAGAHRSGPTAAGNGALGKHFQALQQPQHQPRPVRRGARTAVPILRSANVAGCARARGER